MGDRPVPDTAEQHSVEQHCVEQPPAEVTRTGRAARFVVRRAGWIVLAWLLLTAVLNLTVPQLEEVAGRDASPMVPADAPSLQAVEVMDREFGNGGSESFLVVAMERDGGLVPGDRRYAVDLAADLRQHPDDVAFVQDIANADLRDALTSVDGEARYLLVGITGPTGAPAAITQVELVREVAAEHRPDGLTVAVTGPTATVADLSTETEASVVRITIVTIVMIGAILLLIYRNVLTALLVLTVVGVGLAMSRAVVSWCGLQEVFAVSTFAGSFMTAIVLGAGTDYAVFLVSRYHEQRRLGVPPARAAAVSASRIGSVILGSALTVILATSVMAFADLGFFTTTGPAIAVAIAVNLVTSLTLTPALLVLAGNRGWAEPRGDGGSVWTRVAGTVAAHPGRMLALSLIPLLALAMVYPLIDLSYNTRSTQPDDTESNQGYDLLARHFPINEVLPDYVLVTADHDLRNARDLAVLERAAANVAQQDGVALIRGITRPLGKPLDQATISYQNERIGKRLGDAGEEIAGGEQGAEELADGAGQLSDGAGDLADGARTAQGGAGDIADGTGDLAGGLRQLLDGADAAITGSGDLRDGAAELATGLATAADQVQLAVDGLATIHDALTNRSLTCGLDPACRQSRDGLEQIYTAQRDELIPGLRQAARGARQLARGNGDLGSGLTKLRGGLAQARAGAAELEQGQRIFARRLGDLADGADRLADGAGRIEGGTAEVARTLPELRNGLAQAAEYLRRTGAVARDPGVGGFYLPPAALEDERFAAANGLFLSEDGRTARYAVLGETDAFGHAAAERSGAIVETMDQSLEGTRLASADVTITGMASTNADLEVYAANDLEMIAVFALLAVFLVLLFLLRSLVAAALLMGTVVLSFAAAMGVSVLVWQFLLDQPLDWTVTAVSFTVLVAVGADYNLLLTKRIHEEAPDGSAAGIARATAVTGGVITSAGVIFAASMFALMAGSVLVMLQVGFTIGVGLLLDTFVVRSLLVPALATLLGPRLWWPQRVARRPDPRPVPEPAPGPAS